VPQLINRFGKSYSIESDQFGQKYKFRSASVSVDVLLENGVSVGEAFFSDRPLNPKGEPPNEIVQTILHTNVPGERWHETSIGWGDYELISDDGHYVAVLMYTRPQPESAIWTMVVARSEALPQTIPITPSPSPPPASVVRQLTPSPTPVTTASPEILTSPAPIPIVAAGVQRAVLLITGMSKTNEPISTGTGFFISTDGKFITCRHVIASSGIDHLQVTRTDGSECKVEGILAFSPDKDVVLLKAAVTDADFLRLRSSGVEKPSVGTQILVFGNPGTLRGVWSQGAVSEPVPGLDKVAVLPFDAPVAPGSSGSPVVDINKGDVVGMAFMAFFSALVAGNFAVPFYDLAEVVDRARTETLVSFAVFRKNLEKIENEKPAIKEKVYEKERAGDLQEAARLCETYLVQYSDDVWSLGEHVQISFAMDDYGAAFISYVVMAGTRPGSVNELMGAVVFETEDFLLVPDNSLNETAEWLRKVYGVQVCTVQLPDSPSADLNVLNARQKPDAKSAVVHQFDSDERVFAKVDRVRNATGQEVVTWRKVLLLPSRDRIHGGEGWVNERYIAPWKSENSR
jgi:S1-C subfamily serine protease